MAKFIERTSVTLSAFIAALLVGCGEGADVDLRLDDDATQSGILDLVQGEEVPDNPLESLLNNILLDDGPEIPEFSWSLTGYSIGGADPIDVEMLTPDPNWVSNYFITDTIASEEQLLAAVMDCEQYQYAIELTSPTTIRLGVGEPVGMIEGCVTNAPEGMLRGVFADFMTLLLEETDDETIEISNGNGTVLILTPRME